MRVTPIATLTAALLMGGTLLSAAEPDSHSSINLYGAGPCAAPGYGTQALQPGCCQCQPNCCDDVWAGYCQQKHHGFCLPCLRPMSRMAAPNCSNGCNVAHASPPRNYPIPERTPIPATDPAADSKDQPTPAPQLPPVPASPPASKQLEKPESSSPSDTTTMPFPMFNPAAWKIGAPVK